MSVVEQAPQNGCYQNLCPQVTQLPPLSLGDSPRSAGGSDPGSFQITASALAPWVCEICVHPLRKETFISYSPLSVLNVSPTGLQRVKRPGDSSSRCRTSGMGAPVWCLGHSLLEGNLCSCHHLHLWVTCSGMGIDYSVSHLSPPLHILLWFLYNFNCKPSFLLDSSLSHIDENVRLISFTAALWIVVILLCPWQVNSESSYSTPSRPMKVLFKKKTRHKYVTL